MASAMPKVMHPVGGLPMLFHIAQTVRKAGSTDTAVIVGNQAEFVIEQLSHFDQSVRPYIQAERLGTGHAVLAAREALEQGPDDVIVLNGDAPLIEPETVVAAREALADGADVVVMGFYAEDPTGYGRMLVNDGNLVAIREQKDSSHDEKAINYCNSGIFAFRSTKLLPLLDAIENNNAQGEYYLTDVVEIGNRMGLSVKALTVEEDETRGVNDRTQLADVESIWQHRRRRDLLLSGVTMEAPETVLFSHDTKIGRDTVIEPYVVFGKGVEVAERAHIRAFSHLEGASVGAGAVVGPYARLRPGSDLQSGSKVGNFVETKNTIVGKGAKINHLSYVGDADVGVEANIGAGTITCNYDGTNKHRTTIGAGSFIGTNTALVAPVSVGKSAMTAAGSVITKDVPDEALGIERSDQRNIDGLAAKLRARNKAAKATKSS